MSEKLWHPSWARFMTFFIMFEHVLRHLLWQYIVWWRQKWKNSVKKKNSGNFVHLPTIDGHVQSISIIHSSLILCINLVMPSSYFLLFINALIRHCLISTAHCILEPKVTKRYVQIMNICNPWLCWYILVHTRTSTCSYILVYTRTYSYILSYITMYLESGWIRLAMTYCRCFTLVPCIAHCILPFCGLFDGQASQMGLATPKL